MKNAKKMISMLLVCLLALNGFGVLSAAMAEEKPLQIVCTTFPQYDWTRQVLGDNPANAELTLLLDSGVDLHSYQPTAADLVKISACDLFVYVGGESDEWVEDVAATVGREGQLWIAMVETVDAKAEEMVEGMQESDHDHGHDHEELELEDVEDRSLADFAGEWVSLWPMMVNGQLDEFCEHKAEDDETATVETMREKYTAAWACDVNTIAVEGNQITFTYADGTVVSGEYAYAGFTPKYAEDGCVLSVRYQFETESDGAPKYVQFNDHGHEPGAAEHFHVYFGDEGFEALMSAPSNPYFVPASLDEEGILECLLGHGHDHDHEEEMDEHVWLSLRNAQTITQAIAQALCQLDPANADLYQANADAYVAQLAELDGKYQAVVEAASCHTMLFADRFPFRYLADDYGLDYYAAFAGCSAETEASFETVVFLAKKVDELALHSVLVIEGANHNIAETVVAATQGKDQQILAMDSLQSVTAKNVADGVTYLGIMEANLAVLEAALQ